MKESETNIDKCKATRVMMSPSGALVMALPIFIKLVEGWEQHGYIVYHPAYGEMVWDMSTDEMYFDLGKL